MPPPGKLGYAPPMNADAPVPGPDSTDGTGAPGDAAAGPLKRFGWFSGVFTPSILTILGVIMFLRLGWVVGNAGLIGALAVILISHVITIATGLSVSSIATNRTVGAGGAYNIISRSLGGPMGAAIGIPLFLGQALSITFYIVGFSESVAYLWPDVDQRFLSIVMLVLLTAISMKSAELAIKTQYLILVAIAASLVSIFMGTWHTPPETPLLSPFAGGEPATLLFGIYFPAVTGFTAGVNMSGDLKDARRSLPRGTMFAILAGFVIYMAFPFWLAINASSEELFNNKYAVWDISLVPMLIYLGVWGATLSSAVGSILAAPRTLQALGMDGLAPKIFAKGHGASGEPRNGLLFTFALAPTPLLPNAFGTLDAQGRSLAPRLELPNDVSLVGLPLAFAFAVLDPAAPCPVVRASSVHQTVVV